MDDRAQINEQYGSLKTDLHYTGYSFERAIFGLKWLIQEGRWKLAGEGFDDPQKFLDTIRLDQFRMVAEERQAISKLIKEFIGGSNRQIARTMGVDERTVRRDTAANAAPKEKNANENNDTNVQNAANAAAPLSGAEAARLALRRQGLEAAREERLDRIAEISRGNRELGTAAKYPIILADPPWRYENPPMGGGNRSIENHYPTLSLAEICELPVREIATDDALLYLWATAPKLRECFEVLEAWGFDYRTNFVWAKDKIGMGYHARSQHEQLLVGKRGNIPPPAAADRVSSIIYAERGAHSEKPAIFHELIESFYPTLPKIELFCRSPRDGWAAWGNQVAEAAE
jgi:N6-adenosine-specific RNA methylase IME4